MPIYKNMKKILVLGAFILNIAIIFYFWFDRSGTLLTSGQAGLMIALGRISGLLAVYLILWQLVLIGRVKFLEKMFGLDKLAFVHHINGLLAWIFILLHPIFLVVGYKLANEVTASSQMLDFLLNWEGMFAAILSVVIFVIVIVVSLAAIKKMFRYETWYFIHLATYLAIILAFSHQLEHGNTLQNFIFIGYWYLIYWVAIGLLVYFKFLVPIRLFFKHKFYVSKIVQENSNVVSVYITGDKMEDYNFLGGQFAMFRFLDGRLALESHPFSFSQSKNNQELRITVKNLGDFTATIANKIKIGTKVFIDGPHGIFTTARTENKKIALIAGGVGITPVRALVENTTEKDSVVLYSCVLEQDFIFIDEFKKLNNKISLHLIASQDTSWAGECGRLDEEKLIRLIPDYLDRSFYICGPPLFMKNAIQILHKLHVKKKNIYFEKFSLS
jgi:predicted ferric reductase